MFNQMRPSPCYNLKRSQPNEEVRKLSDALMAWSVPAKGNISPAWQGIIQKKYGRIGFLETKKQTCQSHIKWQLKVWGVLAPGGQGARPPKSFYFFHLKHDKTAIVKVKIQ